MCLIVAIQAVVAVSHNRRLERGFLPMENVYPYAQAADSGDLELQRIEWLFSDIISMAGYPTLNYEIDSPVDIEYYRAIGDGTPAYTIPKGGRIMVEFGFRSLRESLAYGLCSLPTTARGWRLGYRFQAVGDEASDELLYVELKDLRRVALAFMQANPQMLSSPLPIYETLDRLTLQADETLYAHGESRGRGIYISPDLYKPVVPISSVVMLVLGTAAFFGSGWHPKRRIL